MSAEADAGGGAGAGGPAILILPDSEAASEAAAMIIAGDLATAVEARGRAHWATTGGMTPLAIYRLLAVPPLRDIVPWEHVHIWWGDDRWVSRTDIMSNVFACDDALLNLPGRDRAGQMGTEAGAPIPLENVHAIPIDRALAAGETNAWAAAAYEQELRAAGLAEADGMPVFDIVFLGVGPDGHLMSVFPESATWDSPAWVQPVPAPTHIAPRVDRVTLHPRVVSVARLVLPVVLGSRKAEVLGTIFGPELDVRRWPAQLARRPGATWVLDEAAAAGLPPPVRAAADASA